MTTRDKDEDASETKSRKRKRNPQNWRQNIKKRKRQSGLQYVNATGESQRKREIKTGKNCNEICRFRCSHKISPTDRKSIFDRFWSYSDSKNNAFYSNNIDRTLKVRTRTKSENSKRKFSYE